MTWQSQFQSKRVYDEIDFQDLEDYQINKKNIMWTKIKSALVSGVLSAILAGAMYITGLGDVFAIDVHALINIVALAVLTTVVSLLKAGITTDAGTVAGIQVK